MVTAAGGVPDWHATMPQPSPLPSSTHVSVTSPVTRSRPHMSAQYPGYDRHSAVEPSHTQPHVGSSLHSCAVERPTSSTAARNRITPRQPPGKHPTLGRTGGAPSCPSPLRNLPSNLAPLPSPLPSLPLPTPRPPSPALKPPVHASEGLLPACAGLCQPQAKHEEALQPSPQGESQPSESQPSASGQFHALRFLISCFTRYPVLHRYCIPKCARIRQITGRGKQELIVPGVPF